MFAGIWQSGQREDRRREVDVPGQARAAKLLAAVVMSRIEHDQRNARCFFVRQDLRSVAVRTAQKAVVGRVDDDGVVGDTRVC